MARLPTPGSDKGDWGDILNDFLGVAHNTDGTLKDTAFVADGSITTVKLDDNAVTQDKIASDLIDPSAGTPGLRTLGNGANQAMPGNATPTAADHASSHKGGGADAIDTATTSIAGLMASADKTKLDGIETGADVTDATNVAAAGAVMNNAVSSTANTIPRFDGSSGKLIRNTDFVIDDNKNLNLPSASYTGGYFENGKILNASRIEVKHNYTQTVDPASDSKIGTHFLVDWTANIDSTTFLGPNLQPGFLARAVRSRLKVC